MFGCITVSFICVTALAFFCSQDTDMLCRGPQIKQFSLKIATILHLLLVCSRTQPFCIFRKDAVDEPLIDPRHPIHLAFLVVSERFNDGTK